ncbi:MAG: peptide deformylase [Carnobacterium sp.]|uniref:Peptide deformylase n=1 Tax=Carnobacterium antarcticum TaxID=2126436 RepID=A0ABW4NMW8_9LACT|nr:peptide deformylase [Carnobacterium sp. CP1]ALV20941.1 Peptide deformylase [Carnobacterium sp. CP1]
MAVLPIVKYPEPILTKAAREVVEITDEILQLMDDMYETMVASDGIGIAAPQVNRSLRIALVEVDEETGLFEMINPEIITASGKNVDVEGCLSFPEIYGTVERADNIVIRYFDREGEAYEVEAEDYLARVFQHELEHLDGKLFTDKIIQKIQPEELETYMEENGE